MLRHFALAVAGLVAPDLIRGPRRLSLLPLPTLPRIRSHSGEGREKPGDDAHL